MNNKTLMYWSVQITGFLVDIVKVLVTVSGVLAASVADVVMGAIGISLLFGGLDASFFGYSSMQIGGAISLAAGAFQIYMWAILKKRNVGLLQALRFWELPKDIRAFVGLALAILIIDTAVDVSPIPILVASSAYKSIPVLHGTMVVLVSTLVVIICGFSEILTSNIKDILGENSESYESHSRFSAPKMDNQNHKSPYQAKHKPTYRNVDASEQAPPWMQGAESTMQSPANGKRVFRQGEFYPMNYDG